MNTWHRPSAVCWPRNRVRRIATDRRHFSFHLTHACLAADAARAVPESGSDSSSSDSSSDSDSDSSRQDLVVGTSACAYILCCGHISMRLHVVLRSDSDSDSSSGSESSSGSSTQDKKHQALAEARCDERKNGVDWVRHDVCRQRAGPQRASPGCAQCTCVQMLYLMLA